jgi:hypothetical protein
LEGIVGPIGIVWGVLIIVFGLIGLVRGFLKELGVTTVLLVVLFAFSYRGEMISDYVFEGLSMLRISFAGEPRESMAKVSFYIITITIATFISYHGETLAFQGTPPRRIAGVLLALIIGLVNGYLAAGSMWFYLDQSGYPFGLFGALTPLEQELVKILPLTVLSTKILAFLAVFMVIIRVIR